MFIQCFRVDQNVVDKDKGEVELIRSNIILIAVGNEPMHSLAEGHSLELKESILRDKCHIFLTSLHDVKLMIVFVAID